MAFVVGIDPGNGGAIAVWCTDTRRLVSCVDIPVWFQAVGAKKRKRIDLIALMDLFETFNMMGVELAVMEAVGGRPRQSASAGFAFGYCVGVLYSEMMHAKIMVETVPPQRWKKLMNIPGKANAKGAAAMKLAAEQIKNKADEMFPHDRELFRGPNGGYKMDRAEAAMIAKFAGDHVLRTMPLKALGDEEFKLAYRNADTGE